MPRQRLTVVRDDCRPRRRAKPAEVRPHAPLFKALGDETRLEIVALLARAGDEDGLCVCEIEGHFDLSQPTISHHLKILRKAGVLSSARRGTWVYYALDSGVKARLRDFLAALEG